MTQSGQNYFYKNLTHEYGFNWSKFHRKKIIDP